ncbi:MAG: heme exporter protein CcmB [Rhodospirillales bacterium]|jgi:heme exporter protein B
MNAFVHVIRRELNLAFRQQLDSLMVLAFFVLAIVLFPFGVGPEPNILARIAPGIIWVAALLAAMLSLERLFQTDYEDGSLELLALSPLPLEMIVLAKVVTHWLTTGLPLIVAAPVMAVMLNMNTDGMAMLMLVLVLGTPSLSLIGAIGAALILGSRRGGVLLSLLILPLFIPVLIFGVSAIDGALNGLTVKPQLLILSGFFLASLALCPWASAAAIRQSLE